MSVSPALDQLARSDPRVCLLGTSHARRRCTDFLRVDSAITLSTMVNVFKVIPTLLDVGTERVFIRFACPCKMFLAWLSASSSTTTQYALI